VSPTEWTTRSLGIQRIRGTSLTGVISVAANDAVEIERAGIVVGKRRVEPAEIEVVERCSGAFR
jgi:hypothetical protein